MKHTRLGIDVLALLLCALTLATHAEPYAHTPTGLSFPDEIAGLPRTSTFDYEPKAPGLGVSLKYELRGRLTADIYVYTAGVKNVPADARDPLMAQLRQQTEREIIAFAASNKATAQKIDSTIVPVRSGTDTVPVLYDAFELSLPNNKTESYVWLWPACGHFMKIRATWRPGAPIEGSILRDFSEAVVRLTAESSCGKA